MNTRQNNAMEFVLEYLPTQDLLNAAQVCKSWNIIVQSIKKNSVKTQCNTLTGSNFSKPGTLFNQLFKNCIKLHPSYKFCFIIMDFGLYELYAKYLIENVYKSREKFVDYHTLPKLTSDKLHQVLPQSCKSLMLKCVNMVGTDDKGETQEFESFGDNYSVTCALIPDVPGMTCHRFTIGADMFNPSYSAILELEPQEKIKLIILTGYGYDKESPMDYALKCISKEHKETFCYVNILQQEMNLFGENHKEPSILEGVAFTGDNVHATSVKILIDDFSSVDTESEILKLKLNQFHCDKDKSLAFIFMDEKAFRNVYDFIFLLHKHFPGTPVFGMDTLKVIGDEHLGPKPYVQPVSSNTFHTSASAMCLTRGWSDLTSHKTLVTSWSSKSLGDMDETSVVIVLLWWD